MGNTHLRHDRAGPHDCPIANLAVWQDDDVAADKAVVAHLDHPGDEWPSRPFTCVRINARRRAIKFDVRPHDRAITNVNLTRVLHVAIRLDHDVVA